MRNGKQYTYWEARYTEGIDPGTGKQIQRSITGKTQKEVSQKLKAVTISIDDGTYTAPNKMTVAQWLDIWTAEYLGGVKPRTVDSYKSTVKIHLKHGLGALKLESLNAHTIQSFYNGLGEEKNGKEGSISQNCKKHPRRTAQGFTAGRGQWIHSVQSCRCLYPTQNYKEGNSSAERRSDIRFSESN